MSKKPGKTRKPDRLSLAIEALGSADARRQARRAINRAKREGWEQWIRGPIDLRAMLEGYYFDPDAAERVRQFFAKILRLKHPRDARKTIPFQLLDWQFRDVIGPIIGWKRQDGTRRFRKAQVWIPKKNGKTPIAAGLMVYLLIADNEPEPECYSVATTTRQAGLVFREARKFLKKTPELDDLIHAVDHRLRLEVESSDGFYQVLSSDADGADGINASVVIFDELHRQKNRRLYDALLYSFAARTQPLLLITSTAGDDLESIGFEQYEIARKIIDGDVIDHEHFSYIAAAGEDDDPADPKTWRKANPSLGTVLDEDELAAACQRAIDNPREMPNFRRLRLNQWVGSGESFIDMEAWRKITATVEPSALVNIPAYAGLDLSSNTDLTSLVLRFRDGDASRLLAWNWLPEDDLAGREKRDGVPYRRWIDEGYIETTPGDFIDLDRIRTRINEIGEEYAIDEIAYDPAFASQIAVQLADDGFPIFRFRQAASMMTPVLAELDRLTRAGLVLHGSNPVLTWAASNLRVKTTSDGQMKPVKPKRSQKIDPIVALLMSLGPDCTAGELDSGPSCYEEYDADADAEPDTPPETDAAPRRKRRGSVFEDY